MIRVGPKVVVAARNRDALAHVVAQRQFETLAVEQRFLERLAGVTQIRFAAGQLALPFAKKDTTPGVILFDRRTAK